MFTENVKVREPGVYLEGGKKLRAAVSLEHYSHLSHLSKRWDKRLLRL